MAEYEREEKCKTVLRALQKLGLEVRQGRHHYTATCPSTQRKTTLPRHKVVGKFIVGSIYKFLLDNGHDEQDIRRALSW